MSYQDNLRKLIAQSKFGTGDEAFTEDDARFLENYEVRPKNIKTVGYQAPPVNPLYTLVPPFTEVSRTVATVEISDETGSFTVAIEVATQIVMNDANGTEIVFNYAAPE